MRHAILVFLFSFVIEPTVQSQDWEQFGNYWYAGKAELTSYQLSQSRYGEIHEGHSVLIFVTEPFSISKQVKLDRSGSKDEVTVMKLNFTKKFVTGIYPYSMMMSSFVPISYNKYPDALKVTTTSQEWCGHTFTQLNLTDDKYEVKQFSYFESEGDKEVTIDNYWLEDELWQRIRINPESLPRGSIKIFPSTLYIRLKHQEIAVKKAEVTLLEVSKNQFSSDAHYKYSIDYSDRIVNIYFTKFFPYQILGWTEEYDGLVTNAIRMKSILSPYWQKHNIEDSTLRNELGLGPN